MDNLKVLKNYILLKCEHITEYSHLHICSFLGNYLQNRGYKTDISRVTRFDIHVYKCSVARGYVNQST